jgi:hypothetical protein
MIVSPKVPKLGNVRLISRSINIDAGWNGGTNMIAIMDHPHHRITLVG